jgi:F420-dependent oxidoreductase-like protein
MANPTIRFGVQVVPQNTTWPEMLEAWKVIDDAGFDTAWTFDHFYPIFSDPAGPCFEGWMLLPALAAATKNVRLGTLVTGNTYRHPAVLANMAVTLDHTSGGRAILGIGAAWFDLEHHGYGIPYPPVGERIARLDEACTLIKSLWTQTETDFSGRFYTLKGARCEPKPVQKPHPPIMIGGGGEKKTLRVVAKHADTWNWFGTIESFRHKIEILHEHGRAVGRDTRAIEATWGGEAKVAFSAAERGEAVRRLCELKKQSPEEVEANCLIGSPDEIEARIRGYIGVGVSHFLISASPPYDLECFTRFAETVIPRFR